MTRRQRVTDAHQIGPIRWVLRWCKSGGQWPLAVMLLALVLYSTTLAPTVLWGDDAELQRIVVTGEQRTIGQSSPASHLLWLTLASWFVRVSMVPDDIAGRVNFVSALCAAMTVLFVYLAVAEIARQTSSRQRQSSTQADALARIRPTWPAVAGIAAAAALALSHTFWLLAVRPNVYTLQTALIAAALWIVLRWRAPPHRPWLPVAAAGLLGLALFNHALVLASVPGFVWLVLVVPRSARRQLVVAVLLTAALVLVALAGAALRGLPVMDLLGAMANYRAQIPLLRDALLLPVYLAYQFPLSLPLALIGAGWLWHRDRAVLIGLLGLYLGNALLMLTRHHPGMYVRDQFLFYLASYLPVALLIGIGAAVIAAMATSRQAKTAQSHVGHQAARSRPGTWQQRPWRIAAALGVAALIAAPVVIYPLVARFAGEVSLRLAPARHLPGRDPVSFYLLPWKTGYHGAREFGRVALTGLPRDAVVVADWLPFHTLRYLQVIDGLRTDVTIAQLNAGEGVQLRYLLDQERGRPLYLADDSPFPYYERAAIERCFRIEPDGVLYRLERRLNTPCPSR